MAIDTDKIVAYSSNVMRKEKLLKVTQINYVSRNQLHNTANGCQILSFGLSWPG